MAAIRSEQARTHRRGVPLRLTPRASCATLGGVAGVEKIGDAWIE